MNRYLRIIICVSLVFVLTGVGLSFASNARQRISTIQHQSYLLADIQAEIRFGRDLAARILANYKLWDNPRANHYLNLIGHALCFYAGRSELQFSFGLLDTDEINAFATPGGYVFVTRGALQRMTDESQLAALLGHEIAHVQQRHMVRELKIKAEQGSAVGALAGLIGGTTGGVRTALESSLDQAITILFKRGYRLQDELEADRIGLLIASAAGYDPLALGTYLKSVERFEAAPQNLHKDHPVLAQRLAAIDDALAANGLAAKPTIRLKARFYEMVSQ